MTFTLGFQRKGAIVGKLLRLMVLLAPLACASHIHGATKCQEVNRKRVILAKLPWGSSQLPIRMGRHRQLFIDDYVIAEMQGVKQVLNQPKKHSLNPIVVADRPWEGGGVGSPRVWYDEEEGVFRMRYKANHPWALRVCHAVSEDGIHWKKPELNMVDFQGSKKNNLFRKKRSAIRGLHTPWDTDPQKQYKMMAGRHGPGMFSADGINWTTPEDSSAVTNVASDSSINISYD